MLRGKSDRLVHGDAPPNELFFGSSLAMEHRHAFGKLFKGWRTCRYFGPNLGSLYFTFLIFDGLANLLAGYGYRPLRTVASYLFVIGGFALAYWFVGPRVGEHLSPLEALVFSVTSFHGRGFFPGDKNINLSNPLVVLAAAEAIVGLLIEITFIAIFTKRFFFGK